MKNEEAPKSRTLLSIEVEPSEKELFKKAAKSRRLTLSAWARTLMLDEAQRLGIATPYVPRAGTTPLDQS